MREFRTLGSARGPPARVVPTATAPLQIGAVLPPDTHQCLLRWVRKQVLTVTGTHEGTKSLGRGHPKVSSILRPQGLGQHAPLPPKDQDDKSRVTLSDLQIQQSAT